jgi:hypothetical protein
MIFLLALATLAVARQASAAGPVMTFTRSNIGAPATPVEAYLNGQANQALGAAAVIQAQAALVKAVSDSAETAARAADLREKTRGVALDNDMKYTKNFYEKKQLYAAFQSVNSRKRASKEDLTRYSKDSLSQRGSSYQPCSPQGDIRWPAILKREEFANTRIELDSLFQQRRPADGGVGSDFYHETQQLAERMRNELREQMDDFTPAEYMAARRFVDALARDAEMPKGVAGLAAAR